MRNLSQDVRFAARMLVKSRAFTLVALAAKLHSGAARDKGWSNGGA